MECNGNISFSKWDNAQKSLGKLGETLEEYEMAIRNQIIAYIIGIPGDRGMLLQNCMDTLDEHARSINAVKREIYDLDTTHDNYPCIPGVVGGDFTYQYGCFISNASALEELLSKTISTQRDEYDRKHDYGKVKKKEQIGYKKNYKIEEKRKKEFLYGGREKRAKRKAIFDSVFSTIEIAGLTALAFSGVGTPIAIACGVAVAGETISTAGSITDAVQSEKAYKAKMNEDYVRAKVHEETDNMQDLILRNYGNSKFAKGVAATMNTTEFAGNVAGWCVSVANPAELAKAATTAQKRALDTYKLIDKFSDLKTITTSTADIYTELKNGKYGQDIDYAGIVNSSLSIGLGSTHMGADLFKKDWADDISFFSNEKDLLFIEWDLHDDVNSIIHIDDNEKPWGLKYDGM